MPAHAPRQAIAPERIAAAREPVAPVRRLDAPEAAALAVDARFVQDASRVPLRVDAPDQSLERAAIQRKPVVGAADDAYEREADEVADKVMRMTDAEPVRRSPATVQRKCPRCEDEDKASIQPKRATAAHAGAALDAGAAVHAAAQGGAPLSRELRAIFEPRFGRDFSQVRVHTDAAAASGARAVAARAFAYGRDIVFAAGEYAPGTWAGKWLLAHELAHVVQQATPGRSAAGGLQRKAEGGFSPILEPAALFDTYFTEMYAGHFEGIAARVALALQFHPQPARYLQDVFDYAKQHASDWEDNLAAELVSRLPDTRLDGLAASHEGRYALSLMYVAMVTGSVSEFEHQQANRVLFAKARTYSRDAFVRKAQRRDNGLATRVFPVRFMRVTGGDYATPQAVLQPDGMVRVSYPQRLATMDMFRRELRTIGNFIGGDGDLINANEIVIIKDYERGGTETPLPALALVDYANQSSRSTLGKILEVSIFAATLGIGSAAVAGAEAGEAAAVRFTATAIWGARIARAVRLLDMAANVIGVAAFVIDENRQWIVQKLGPAGEWLVRIADIANTAVAIYGLVRLAHTGVKLARDFHAAADAAHTAARGLTEAQASIIEEIDAKLAQLAREADEEAAQAAPAAEHAAGQEAGARAGGGEKVRASALAHGIAPQTLEDEVAQLRSQAREPDNVLASDGAKLDAEMTVEVRPGEPHHFERNRASRTWCRHSTEACGLELAPELNAEVDKALETQAAASRKAAHVPAPPAFDMKSIGAPTEPAQMLGSDFSAVKLKPGQDALYILREADGTILKVGKTSAGAAKGRFAVYRAAGKLTGKELALEVYPLQASARNAEYYESALRRQMEEMGGHRMPWDNTRQRLGWPGFGTPGEGLRSPPVTRGEMRELLVAHQGNLREVGKDLGVHRRTVDLWAKALGLNPQDFKR